MGLKAALSKPFAAFIVGRIERWKKHAVAAQQKTMLELVGTAKNTVFGKEHGFAGIKSYEDFKKQVPIRDYEGLKTYIDRVVAGEKDVMWKGKPAYFAKT